MNSPVKVGLIGYGFSSEIFHAPFIVSNPNFLLKLVVERHSGRSKYHYPWVNSVKNIEGVLSDSEIELVVVATPNTTHYEHTRKALLAEKHVVVDKPFTVTTNEAQDLIDLAEKKKKVLSVYQNRRWDGGFLTVKKVIESKILGRIVNYESHFDRFRNCLNPEAWRDQSLPGSGILYDLGSHLLDQVQCLFGPPKTITADIRIQREGGVVDDYFEVRLDYGDLQVIARAGMLVREQGAHFMIHGTQGSFVKHGMDPQEADLLAGKSPSAPSWGIEPVEKWGVLNTDFKGIHFKGRVETIPGSYQDYYQNIYETIRGQSNLIVKPEEACNTIRMIELAIKSDSKKHTVDYKDKYEN
ncbi:oxidoreductase [Thermodesulfobacteriota bacterium]